MHKIAFIVTGPALILALSIFCVFSLWLPFVSLFLSESPISIVGSSCNISSMANQQDKGRPLPKFGEWDVNNPASAEGFTVIFSKAREEKKSNDIAAAGGRAPSQRNVNSSKPNENYQYPPPVKKWFCCF